ncbi:hypothetical protein VNI00_006653 [Paramarasmius palmivorus]|uniref:F-box domain-containing protein n=1 Tax=Paramarasmius palmivorus TaxID=297713 RepID=A0AAW0DAY7_9AGAR
MSPPIFTFKSPDTLRNLDLKELFRARSTISTRDRQTIKQYLKDVEDDVRRCETEEKNLLAAMKMLESRRKGLEKSMELYRSLLSPIHKLPPEILSNIFKECCEYNELNYDLSRPEAMSLSMVCGRWRDIVLSTPALWSNLRLEAASLKIKEEQRPAGEAETPLAEMVNLFMERSKKMPLTLEIIQCDLSYPVEPIFAAFDVLVRNMDRWLDVTFWSHRLCERLPARRHLPILKNLDVSWSVDIKPDTFSNCPALTSVECCPVLHCDLLLPWGRVKVLTLSNSNAEDSLSILSKCHELERLELDSIGDESDELQGVGSISLPRLHSLSLRSFYEPRTMFVFHSAKLPSLSTLIFSGYTNGSRGWASPRVIPSIEAFLLRSQCTITSLTVEVQEIDDHQTLALLRLLPTLETLVLRETRNNHRIFTSHFLKWFTVEDGTLSSSPAFLPRLSDLTLTVLDKWLDAEALSSAIVSRWKPAPECHVESLRSVDLTVDVFGHTANWRQLRWLENLRATGLRFTLSLYP